MKKIITAVFAIILSAGALQAQTKESGKFKGGEKKAQGMGAYQSLNLTEEQKTRFKALRESFKKESEALKAQESSLTASQMKERKQALMQKHRAEIESILTPEQKEQLAKQKGEGRGKGQFKSGKRARGGENTMAEELNLSAEQKAKISSLRKEFQDKAEAIRKDERLDREAKRKAFQQLHNQNKEQMKAVLTKEQAEKIEAQRGKRPQRATR